MMCCGCWDEGWGEFSDGGLGRLKRGMRWEFPEVVTCEVPSCRPVYFGIKITYIGESEIRVEMV